MRKPVFISLLAAVLAVFLCAEASAACDSRKNVVKELAEKYKEQPVHRGIDANGHMLEIFVSKDGTWTAVTTRPNGMACLNASGVAWETIKRKEGKSI